MGAQGGDVRAHGVEHVQRGLVLEQGRGRGRVAEVVTRRDEHGTGARLADPGDLAGQRDGSGVGDRPGRGIGGSLDVTVQVGDAENGNRSLSRRSSRGRRSRGRRSSRGVIGRGRGRRDGRGEPAEGQRREHGDRLHTGIRSHDDPGREGEWGGIPRIGGDGGRVARRTRLSPARHHTETHSDPQQRRTAPEQSQSRIVRTPSVAVGGR